MRKLNKTILLAILTISQIVITACGKEDHILPIEKTTELPIGSLSGIFEIGNNEQVRFSQGNLCYCMDGEHLSLAGQQQGIWTFCNTQYSTQQPGNGILDQFNYGTSGYNNFHPCVEPDYENIPVSISNPDPWYDWGIFNAIENGGNRPNLWRTLSAEEWDYLLNNQIYGFANIVADANLPTENNPIGMVILPKQFSMPEGLTFKSHVQHNKLNIYTLEEWNQMETMGAVFIQLGSYWCYKNNDEGYAKYIDIADDKIEIIDFVGSYSTKKVRLVQDIR
ncbi:MAG: hypothetical protein KBT06_09220 [Prevotellaceae bacterium]|nr:hypothetical protein [Candidatus Colivivens equi]